MRTERKPLALLLMTLFFAVSAYAQAPEEGEPSDRGDMELMNNDSMECGYDGAHIMFVRTSHDFGDIRRNGGNVTAEFEYVNDGSEPLVITRITVSCTCIKFDYSRRPLPPGGRAVIKLTYEPHKVEPGTFHKVIQIYTNSGGGVRLLTLQGNSIE